MIAKKLVAQSKLDDALSALQSAQANFRKTQASLEEAQTTYGYSIIAAPFDGVITQKLVNKGDIASPGVAMLSLYNPLTLMMESDIAASKRYLLKLGQQWPVSLPEQNIMLAGVISEITPASDAGSRSVVVKLTFENNQQPLYPGLFARVKIKTDEHQALIIPQASTYRIGQLQYVKVVDGDRVVPRLIETRPYNEQQLIIRKGVTAGTVLLAEPR